MQDCSTTTCSKSGYEQLCDKLFSTFFRPIVGQKQTLSKTEAVVFGNDKCTDFCEEQYFAPVLLEVFGVWQDMSHGIWTVCCLTEHCHLSMTDLWMLLYVSDVGDGNRPVQGVISAVWDGDIWLHAALINPGLINLINIFILQLLQYVHSFDISVSIFWQFT